MKSIAHPIECELLFEDESLKKLKANSNCYDYCQFKFGIWIFSFNMKSKGSKHPILKKRSLRKLNVPRLRHASLFSFFNSCPQSNHFSAASACFPKVFQMWVRFGILPETKSKLALKLAVVHFAAHVWITNFLVKRTSWYSPTKKNICSAVSKIWRNGLASKNFQTLHVLVSKKQGFGLVPFIFLFVAWVLREIWFLFRFSFL